MLHALFFCMFLVSLANISKKEDTMKTIKTQNNCRLPDRCYDSFGIYVSGSGNPNDKVPLPDPSGKFCSESDRIVTLARESRYETYLPVLRKVNLLSLNYPSLPFQPKERPEYVKKVIRNSIRKTLASISPNGRLCQGCTDYVSGCFNHDGTVSISLCSQNDDAVSMLACEVLGSTEAIRLTFLKLGNIAVYANPFGSRKPKYSYYHLRNDHSVKAHVIDLLSLLTDALVLNALYEPLKGDTIPLVQNMYDRFAASIMQHPKPTSEEMEVLGLIQAKKAVPYEHLFHFSYIKKDAVPFQGMASRLSSGLYGLFCEILEIYQDVSCESLDREQSRSIATAFITKKNIPKTVLSAMEQTGFLRYFKYVEFDEDTDLESASAIEKEFVAMNKAYFSGSTFPVAIRFRKLGKHKASGLYYPFFNTLCVDIRSPSSFMHEYFHMIDNQLGDLSLDIGFQDVAEQYREAFLKGLEKEDAAIKAKLKGHSKYNISYYFRRAEIFARCGEIYLLRILKAESSLLQSSLGYAYPESETLDSLIGDYYQSLLQETLARSIYAKTC